MNSTGSHSEDKTCRMCGYADKSNLNIFQTKQVYQKILALYPVVLYKSDPLPKNICLKCYSNTVKRYDEYVRISRIQTKWINNVRNNQPNNPYIKILDKIDQTNKTLIEYLKKLGADSMDESLSVTKFNTNQFPDDIRGAVTKNGNSMEGKNTNIKPLSSNEKNSNKILLSYLKSENQTNENESKSNPQMLKKSLSKSKKQTDFKDFPINKCRYCFKLFPSQKFLALHQAKRHLKLAVFKSFTKKQLSKRSRLGRIIKSDNKTCLRCENCWKCFDCYESILNHWQNKHCEFYCVICGKEFPTDPDLLRKHLRTVHFLTYKYYQDIIVKGEELEISVDIPDMKTDDIDFMNESSIIDPSMMEAEDSSSSLLADFKSDPFEFVNIKKPKIPVLKLKRKSDSEGHGFNIKLDAEAEIDSPYGSPNSSDNESDSMDKPLLRVKNLMELQHKSAEENEMEAEEEYITLSQLKLNTINIEGENSEVIEQESYQEEIREPNI